MLKLSSMQMYKNKQLKKNNEYFSLKSSFEVEKMYD